PRRRTRSADPRVGRLREGRRRCEHAGQHERDCGPEWPRSRWDATQLHTLSSEQGRAHGPEVQTHAGWRDAGEAGMIGSRDAGGGNARGDQLEGECGSEVIVVRTTEATVAEMPRLTN